MKKTPNQIFGKRDSGGSSKHDRYPVKEFKVALALHDMFKRLLIILLVAQALLTLLETYLISKVSFIGKIGIAIIHREYQLLRSPWKTFLLLYCLQLIVVFVLTTIRKRNSNKRLLFSAAIIIVIALLGLFATFHDFQNTYSHRLLKERFHLGFYLFWFAMITTGIFFILNPKPEAELTPPAEPL